MRVRILLGLALSGILTALGQSPPSNGELRSLSLRDCIDMALTRNLDLQIQRLTKDVAGFNYSAAYGAYAPTFSFEARNDFVSQPGNFDPQKSNPDFPYELESGLLSSSLSGSTPIGLDYSLGAYTRLDDARTDFRGIPSGSIRETNNYFSEAKLTLQQHLLKDFWIDAERQLIQIRRKDLKSSEQAFQFQVMRTVLAVEVAYYDLVMARENVRVQEKALELRQQLVSETRRRVQVGDLPPLDADQAETEVQNTLTALIAAREALVAQQNALKRLITDEFREWADTELKPTDKLLVIPKTINRSESFFSALKDRPDLKEARLAVEKNDVVVRFRKNQLFPSLDLVGGYGGLGVADEMGQSLNHTFNFRDPEYYYGVVLSVPLSNIAARNAYQASKSTRQMAKLQLKRAEEEVLLQIADLVNRAQSRYAQVESTRKARTYGEAALAAEQRKLENGLTTAFVVLQLQDTLTNARTSELKAMADYNKVIAQLEFADATLLDRHHLTVEVK
jgi:outer membrane protein TolC